MSTSPNGSHGFASAGPGFWQSTTEFGLCLICQIMAENQFKAYMRDESKMPPANVPIGSSSSFEETVEIVHAHLAKLYQMKKATKTTAPAYFQANGLNLIRPDALGLNLMCEPAPALWVNDITPTNLLYANGLRLEKTRVSSADLGRRVR